MSKKNKTALNPLWLVGIVVFGGVDPETGLLARKNSSQEGFSKVWRLKAWDKIGSAPIDESVSV